MGRQENVMQPQIEDVGAHDPHNLVSLHIVHVEHVKVVKAVIERSRNLESNIYHRIEDPNLLELDHFNQVKQFARSRS